ncbi:MAG: carbamoyltransferase HypF [Actinomycetia bacterium]|nr:carbamoyltransferase HypF [Actinomycetes bacterium]
MTIVQQGARTRFVVTGIVQGVGFRPFVHGLAIELRLAGFVGNDSSGVFIETEGPPAVLEEFRRRLYEEAPPAARIQTVEETSMATLGASGFSIAPSVARSSGSALVSPDLATCDACISELENPTDRRYRYAFVNCTNCGPRFTITLTMPYDRPQTTMDRFTMCERCHSEYENPQDRRFHAQPNACPDCGPEVWFERNGSRVTGHAVTAARKVVADGGVVAVKGLGGFHLACDAFSELAVSLLRERKGRVDKPFAVMVADLDTARTIAHLTDDEEELLMSRERPITLLPKKHGTGLSEIVAPWTGHIGVMVAYTPLHRLLITPGDVWVMTSGNRSQEPIVNRNEEARSRLASLADAFVMHDRDIHVPVDDSVMRKLDGADLPVRRSRGYAPFPVALPIDVPPLLATGGELKATFCLASGRHGFMSQHIGDMENLETLDAFSAAVGHMQGLFRVTPQMFATDLHPGYLSGRWAERIADGRPVVRVQHHHAHIASVMAENGVTAPVIGFSFDGTGYGTDATIWGGEVLIADFTRFERLAHLATAPLPGGDAAVRRPYRMAMAHLWAAGIPWSLDLPPVAAASPEERRVLLTQLERNLNVVQTSSMGRLFDAVAALAGVRQEVTYEAQAALELEALADATDDDHYVFEVRDPVIDPAPVLRSVIRDTQAGVPVGVVAMRFHRAVVDMIVSVAITLRDREGIGTVGLSGGVFQNVTLTGLARRLLEENGFRVLTHRLVPPNDGGLALGQAMVASAKVR